MSATFVQYVLTKYWRVKRNLPGHSIEYAGEPLGTWVYFMKSVDRAYIIEQILFYILFQNVQDKSDTIVLRIFDKKKLNVIFGN